MVISQELGDQTMSYAEVRIGVSELRRGENETFWNVSARNVSGDCGEVDETQRTGLGKPKLHDVEQLLIETFLLKCQFS